MDLNRLKEIITYSRSPYQNEQQIYVDFVNNLPNNIEIIEQLFQLFQQELDPFIRHSALTLLFSVLKNCPGSLPPNIQNQIIEQFYSIFCNENDFSEMIKIFGFLEPFIAQQAPLFVSQINVLVQDQKISNAILLCSVLFHIDGFIENLSENDMLAYRDLVYQSIKTFSSQNAADHMIMALKYNDILSSLFMSPKSNYNPVFLFPYEFMLHQFEYSQYFHLLQLSDFTKFWNLLATFVIDEVNFINKQGFFFRLFLQATRNLLGDQNSNINVKYVPIKCYFKNLLRYFPKECNYFLQLEMRCQTCSIISIFQQNDQYAYQSADLYNYGLRKLIKNYDRFYDSFKNLFFSLHNTKLSEDVQKYISILVLECGINKYSQQISDERDFYFASVNCVFNQESKPQLILLVLQLMRSISLKSSLIHFLPIIEQNAKAINSLCFSEYDNIAQIAIEILILLGDENPSLVDYPSIIKKGENIRQKFPDLYFQIVNQIMLKSQVSDEFLSQTISNLRSNMEDSIKNCNVEKIHYCFILYLTCLYANEDLIFLNQDFIFSTLNFFFSKIDEIATCTFSKIVSIQNYQQDIKLISKLNILQEPDSENGVSFYMLFLLILTITCFIENGDEKIRELFLRYAYEYFTKVCIHFIKLTDMIKFVYPIKSALSYFQDPKEIANFGHLMIEIFSNSQKTSHYLFSICNIISDSISSLSDEDKVKYLQIYMTAYGELFEKKILLEFYYEIVDKFFDQCDNNMKISGLQIVHETLYEKLNLKGFDNSNLDAMKMNVFSKISADRNESFHSIIGSAITNCFNHPIANEWLILYIKVYASILNPFYSQSRYYIFTVIASIAEKVELKDEFAFKIFSISLDILNGFLRQGFQENHLICSFENQSLSLEPLEMKEIFLIITGMIENRLINLDLKINFLSSFSILDLIQKIIDAQDITPNCSLLLKSTFVSAACMLLSIASFSINTEKYEIIKNIPTLFIQWGIHMFKDGDCEFAKSFINSFLVISDPKHVFFNEYIEQFFDVLIYYFSLPLIQRNYKYGNEHTNLIETLTIRFREILNYLVTIYGRDQITNRIRSSFCNEHSFIDRVSKIWIPEN